MKIYNSLTRKKEPFEPITPGVVKMYTCGQTVYNDIHLGNARFYVVFDAIRRYLLHKGFDVRFVQNFTDIDDKIIQRARDEGCSSAEIAERFIERTLCDLEGLNVLPAVSNPKATESIEEIIEFIQELSEKGFAYENQGTVYYDVKKFPEYGKLSRKNPDDLEAGARVEVEAGKRNPMDFVLWKPAKPGEPKWTSPWGDGRPGWHIECSAMIRKFLGDSIDIHGGAEDLIFPHHENEIAQSEALTSAEFAKYWMHCGILTADHKKMSKSRGNFQTLRETSAEFPMDVLRFYFLSVHYRMPMEFGDVVLKGAGQGFRRIRACYANLSEAAGSAYEADLSDEEIELTKEAGRYSIKFNNAMDDDFNTADAIAAIFELVRFSNSLLAKPDTWSKGFLLRLKEAMLELCGVLGLSIEAEKKTGGDDSEVEALIEARQEARKAKNFAEADRIRNELTEMGIILEDTAGGVRWRRS